MKTKRAIARRAWLGVVAGAGILQFAAPAAAACSVDAKVSPASISIPDYIQDATGKWIPNTVQINGNGSKPSVRDGGLYQWSFPNGAFGTLANANTPQVMFTPPNVDGASRQVRIRLTVSEAGCPSDSDDILVTVTDAEEVLNSAPHAVTAASTTSAREGTVVTLDGSGSWDVDKDALTYAWVQTGGPSVALQPSANPAFATFVAPNLAAPAVLTFRLTVTDPGKLSSVDSIDINIDWNNDAPVAALQCPAVVPGVSERASVTLDASGSTDSDNGIVGYAWEQLVGLPEVPGVTGWNTPKVTFDAPSLGQGQTGLVPFKVTVTDASGAKSSAQCSVFINDVTAPVITVPGPDPAIAEATSAAGANVSYVASAFDAVDGSLPIGTENFLCEAPSGSRFALDASTAVLCSAKDSAGNTAEKAFSIRVVDSLPPVLAAPSSIAVEATGPSGAVATFDITSNDVVDGVRSATCAPASGSTFPIDPADKVATLTHVTCGATDAHRNNAAPVTFDVAVHDTTAPAFDASSVSGNLVLEATGPAGAVATFATPVAHDLVDLTSVSVACAPASGSTFGITETAVRCDAADTRGNTTHDDSSAAFKVTVQDTLPPVLNNVPANQIVEATSGLGAAVTYAAPTAFDVVDGDRPVACSPAAGTFGLGITTVSCTASDTRGHTASGGFTVSVVDTTAPTLTVPGTITVEATGPDGAPATFATSALDIVDGGVAPVCTATSGDTFPLGTTKVSCTATDKAGNVAQGSFDVLVHDTTAPLLTLPILAPVEATGPKGAAVVFAVRADDAVDGSVAPACSPKSGDTFALGTTTVTCSATDAAGNTGTGMFDVAVQDTTGPVIAAHADVHVYATANSSGVLQYALPSAIDLVDGAVAVDCSPASGSTGQVGVATTVTCNAKDSLGNAAAPTSFKVYVDYNFTGFFQPVDLAPAVNSVKAGSAIPVKFSLGGNQGLSIFAANNPASFVSSCAGTAEAAIEETVTAGASSLQYDSTTGQYIYVWKTDKAWVGTCRTLQVKFKDGTAAKVAIFKFK